MESYNNPFSFASDADLMPFWNHSDFNILGDHNSSSCQILTPFQPVTEPLDACFKSQSTPTSVVDAAAPVKHHNHHPVEIIPPPSLAPPANLSSSINYGHNYHYNNQIDEPHNHPMISEFNFPNPAHKWELPQPMMAFKSMNNSHQNHHHHHPATSSSSSSSYSVELDEALSLAPEDEEEESHDAPFLIPSPPSSHHPGPHHHSQHHQQHHHQHHPSSAHFLPPSPSSSSSGVPLPVIESTSSLKNPQFKRLREEVYNDQTDMSIDCQEMSNGGAASSPTSVDEEDPTGGFKLPASKSPIMEAMVVCALNGWGIDIVKNNRPTSTSPAEVVFRVFDFNRYYKISRLICSKQRPTDDLGSRIKSLRRWFVNFPKKRDRCENAFFLQVKPTIAKKVNEIIERNSRSMGLVKRSRKQ